ncbi:23S rRNA (uracil1939-C5)-methyltransferase [Ruminococcaceae bacterium R-25]|nr:23S rRNA (uracil1939-C5)-methyltransferase [Ruminococcaceae bacterium R-25]SUQ22318.1 23S rRNA (uracil1939-C5)-methyltransferase [Oscillospiraceae bacterium]
MKPSVETEKSRMLKALGIKNNCPVAKKCGGCSYAGKTYFEQTAAKEKLVKSLISPFCEVLPIHHCENPLYYRNKVHSAFKKLRNGRIICGPYEANSHRIVETDSCLIENQTASAIIRDCAAIAERLKISIYNEVNGTGDLRRILVRTADATGEVMVVLVIGSAYFNKKKLFTDELLKLHPEITTLLINVNKRHDSMILGSDEVKKVKGSGYITDEILGKRFRVSADSFMQSNHDQAEILYSEAIRLADFEGDEVCIDAYCGTGSTTLSFANFVGEITGIEIKEAAYNDAIKNAKINNIEKARFVLGDATLYMEKLAKTDAKIDCVILDPTRAGTTIKFIKACGKLKPSKIVYISCCAETLARDLKVFETQGYKAQIAKPVDMFPWTDKVETIVILNRDSKE